MQFGDTVALEKLGLESFLHVGDHGLQGFLADLGPVAHLIAHAAGLAAHAWAQVLQVFLARIAFHSCHQPTRLAMRRVYLIAAQPPPRFIRFMVGKSCGESPVSGDGKFEEEPELNCTSVLC